MKPKFFGEVGEREKSFDEKMKDGADVNAGIEGSMPMRGPYERPWTTEVHKTTRCNDDKDN